MNPPRNTWSFVCLTLCLALVLGIASGCEEDDPEVEGLPAGEGTLESPYILQSGTEYQDVPIEPGGTLFFIAPNVPAGFNDLTTESTVDIDLHSGGFSNFFDESQGNSATPESGNEFYAVVGDDSSDYYFQIDGTGVFQSGADFDISLMSGSAPEPLLFTLPAAVGCAAPSIGCGDDINTSREDIQLALAVPPDVPLMLTMTQNLPAPAWVLARARESFSAGSYSPFPYNNNIYGNGYCHINTGGGSPLIFNTGTCQIHPASNYKAPTVVRFSNNSGTADIEITVEFSVP